MTSILVCEDCGAKYAEDRDECPDCGSLAAEFVEDAAGPVLGLHARCVKTIKLTPSDPNYERNLRGWFRRSGCWKDET